MVYSAEMQRTKSEGYLEGIEYGKVEGKVEGRDEERVSSLRNLILKAGWTLEKAMEMLGIPLSERDKYAAHLQNA